MQFPKQLEGETNNKKSKSMESMSLTDYAAVKELENHHRDDWGSATALWVLVAAVIVVAIVYNWTKNCNEKVAFATSLSDLAGKVNCIAPQVQTLNSQMYGAAQTFAGLTVGVNELRERTAVQLDALNNTVYWNPINSGYVSRSSCGCGCNPNRVFAQSTQYAQTGTPTVTVTESCGNDRV